MSNFDFSPLYRTVVGFDRLASMIDTAQRLDGAQGYPPYNIEQSLDDENVYAIELAVAGFGEADLDIEVKEGQLLVVGKKETGDDKRRFVHRGIAERGFIRRFQLADHVVVTGAALRNGLLRIELRRELPEAMKPRKIAIEQVASARAAEVIEHPTPPTKVRKAAPVA
ncbi:MAG: Hsp20 family protein [Alphaproteobacteria bacterium]|nr:Hsp20 family protein [Alphaproteobacteria bacterium]